MTTYDRVLKLPAGSNIPVELPFTGLSSPVGVTVDNGGNIYVTEVDSTTPTHSRVLKLLVG